ncbi:MAG: hypothetical protein K5668_09415 [Lachnospiraceae bacterium]|nr:hypothetical protein [Lachnospiraceae bacterium]
MIYQCIGERSEKPYIIKDTGTGIYSMEELLYYVRENVFMLDPKDFGASLARFIRKRLNLPDIASKYDEMLDRGLDFSDRICMLFSETRFVSDSELETLKKALKLGERMSSNDSHRVRGDFYFKSGRIPEAVIEYNAALKTINRDEDPSDAARLLTGMGNAAARNFKFGRALKYYEEALNLSPGEPALLDKLIVAARLEMNDEAFSAYMERRSIPESIYSVCLNRMKEAEKRALRKDDAKRLKEALTKKQEGDYTGFTALRRSVLNDWKTRYRNKG